MRLSPAVNSNIKSKHLFPSSKMSFLKNSNEKLNDICIADDCKDLPGILVSKANHLARQWYDQTEDHRLRLLNHLRKNWIRLLFSAVVLMAQFAWFTSNLEILSGDGGKMMMEKVEICQESQSQQPQSEQLPSDLILSTYSNAEPNPVISSLLAKHLLVSDYPTSVLTINNSDQQMIISSAFESSSSPSNQRRVAESIIEPQQKEPLDHQQSRPSTSSSSSSSSSNSTNFSVKSWLAAFLWKTFFLLKLACVMIFFELLRLSDTVVNVIRQISDEEDEKHRSPPKSPVDTGYIERNRGYK